MAPWEKRVNAAGLVVFFLCVSKRTMFDPSLPPQKFGTASVLCVSDWWLCYIFLEGWTMPCWHVNLLCIHINIDDMPLVLLFGFWVSIAMSCCVAVVAQDTCIWQLLPYFHKELKVVSLSRAIPHRYLKFIARERAFLCVWQGKTPEASAGPIWTPSMHILFFSFFLLLLLCILCCTKP